MANRRGRRLALRASLRLQLELWLGLAWLGLAWLGLAWLGTHNLRRVFAIATAVPSLKLKLGLVLWKVQEEQQVS